MAINIEINGEFAAQELRSLYDWLLREPGIRLHADVQLVVNEPDAGQMGAKLDLITLAVTSGLQLPSFAAAVAAWRKTRRQRPSITIERDGVKVVLDDGDPEVAARILDAMGDDD